MSSSEEINLVGIFCFYLLFLFICLFFINEDESQQLNIYRVFSMFQAGCLSFKHSLYMMSLNPHPNLIGQVLIYPLFTNDETGLARNLPKDMNSKW